MDPLSYFGQGKMRAVAGATASALLRVWNEPRTLMHSAIDSAAAANAGAVFAGFELNAVRNASCWWVGATQAVSQQRPLQIVVLGGSVTVGCGAAHPLQRCDALSSWTRILHDQLVAAFGGQSERVEMAVWGKSAIRPAYFTECTSSKVSETAHVVLLEVQANLWFAGQRSCPRCAASLKSLVEHVRCAAPSAAIMFVGWPVRDGPHTVESVVRQVANAHELDAWFASSWVELVRSNWIRNESLHADHVHPTPIGHALLACGTSRFLLERLRKHAPCKTIPRAPPPPLFHEWCYLNAAELPINSSTVGSQAGGWSLVDEGAAKQVSKLGFLSLSYADDPLQLGPLPRDDLKASLGYLQSWREDYGALQIGCTGSCSCRSGIVETSATRVSHYNGYEFENATVTVSVEVHVKRRNDSRGTGRECFLMVTHVAPNKPPAPVRGRTRVRVDSLSLRACANTGCDSKKWN